jgi:hypothetical protein
MSRLIPTDFTPASAAKISGDPFFARPFSLGDPFFAPFF